MTSVSFSPDGNQIASGSWDNTIRLWDAKSGQPIGSSLKGHTSQVYSVTFSPDGRRIVSSSEDTTIRFWDARTGQPTAPQAVIRPISSVSLMAIFPDGQRLVSVTLDDGAQVWSIESRKTVATLAKGDMASIVLVAIWPGESYIVMADLVGRVCVWDSEKYRLVSTVDSHVEGPTSISFSSNANTLILSSRQWHCLSSQTCPWEVDHSVYTSNSTTFQNETLSFDRNQGWTRGGDDAREKVSLRWLPLDDPDAGMWGYVDGKLIRRSGVDYVTICEANDDV